MTLNLGVDTGVSGLEGILAGLPTYGIQLNPFHSSNSADYIFSSKDLAELASKMVSDWQNREYLNYYLGRQQTFVKANRSAEAMVNAYLNAYEG